MNICVLTLDGSHKTSSKGYTYEGEIKTKLRALFQGLLRNHEENEEGNSIGNSVTQRTFTLTTNMICNTSSENHEESGYEYDLNLLIVWH